jgi:hypothetical protein
MQISLIERILSVTEHQLNGKTIMKDLHLKELGLFSARESCIVKFWGKVLAHITESTRPSNPKALFLLPSAERVRS